MTLKRSHASSLKTSPLPLGDDRRDLGEGIRSTYEGSYIIYFREKDSTLEIVRVVRGDLEFPFL